MHFELLCSEKLFEARSEVVQFQDLRMNELQNEWMNE